jgi:hypothetical protein
MYFALEYDGKLSSSKAKLCLSTKNITETNIIEQFSLCCPTSFFPQYSVTIRLFMVEIRE